MTTNSSLTSLTMDRIREAFNKAKSETILPPGVRLELITEEHYHVALEYVRQNFSEEPIKTSLELKWTDEYEEIWLRNLRMNMSLMLVDEKSNAVIGIRGMKIIRRGECDDLSALKDVPLKIYLEHDAFSVEQSDFFGYFGTAEAILFFGLSINKKFTRRGYGSLILNAAINMIRNFGIDPVYIKVDASSNFSKKIFEKYGFEKVIDLPFAEYVVDGKQPIHNTGIHTSVTIYGLRISQNTN